jgi:hypothetical protein
VDHEKAVCAFFREERLPSGAGIAGLFCFLRFGKALFCLLREIKAPGRTVIIFLFVKLSVKPQEIKMLPAGRAGAIILPG